MVFILPDPNVEATLTNYTFCYGNGKLVTVYKRVINSLSCVVGRTGGSCAEKSLLAAWSSQPRRFVALTAGGKAFLVSAKSLMADVLVWGPCYSFRWSLVYV